MNRRKVSMVILCEDRQQEVFARHYLVQCGVPRAKIRTNICPKGKQAGEQYVRTQYPMEVKAYRSKSPYLSIGLTVVIDADTGIDQDRWRRRDWSWWRAGGMVLRFGQKDQKVLSRARLPRETF